MANEEHLKILEDGVYAWNEWRKNNPHIKPDLKGVRLHKIDLQGINLEGATLLKADLQEVNLIGAKLKGADLRGVRLNKSKLGRVDLSGRDLKDANFFEANLKNANLSGANLSGAVIQGANLLNANLSRVDLRGNDLSFTAFTGANLSRTNLSGRDLSGKSFKQVIFVGANLDRVNLSGTKLNESDFRQASLKETSLINSRLDGANLTDACLWETQRTGWSIKGVICESVYWDKEAKEKTEYAPGEFERLFAEQTKIRLFYKGGISPLEIATLPALIQHLEEMQGCSLRFVSITESAGGAVVELAIENTEELSYEKMESLTRSIKESAAQDIQILRDKINVLNGTVEGFEKAIKLMLSEGKGDTYNISGPVGAAGRDAHAHDNTLNQIVNAENSEVKTQIQGNRNVAIDGDVNDGNISSGDKSNNE
jgi:uncharacterized protein YjbI with pentapeptide repeats